MVEGIASRREGLKRDRRLRCEETSELRVPVAIFLAFQQPKLPQGRQEPPAAIRMNVKSSPQLLSRRWPGAEFLKKAQATGREECL